MIQSDTQRGLSGPAEGREGTGHPQSRLPGKLPEAGSPGRALEKVKFSSPLRTLSSKLLFVFPRGISSDRKATNCLLFLRKKCHLGAMSQKSLS